MIKLVMRNGTCVAVSEVVQCLEISKDQYLLKVKKVNQDRLNKQSKFLKQIPFMKKWPNKDIYEFNSFLKLQSYPVPGTVVLQEGQTDD